jgi:hypothetical protein
MPFKEVTPSSPSKQASKQAIKQASYDCVWRQAGSYNSIKMLDLFFSSLIQWLTIFSVCPYMTATGHEAIQGADLLFILKTNSNEVRPHSCSRRTLSVSGDGCMQQA